MKNIELVLLILSICFYLSQEIAFELVYRDPYCFIEDLMDNQFVWIAYKIKLSNPQQQGIIQKKFFIENQFPFLLLQIILNKQFL